MKTEIADSLHGWIGTYNLHLTTFFVDSLNGI